ncbi:MAG TPA: LysR family transcriptional regulator [Polyangiaceae bacterium]
MLEPVSMPAVPALRQIDLNLLLVLATLLEERSVTRAASRLGRTQSAVSHALGRLRELLNDELLTRSPQGMEPTLHALELIEPLKQALSLFQRVVEPPSHFEPLAATGVMRIGAVDYFASVLLPAYVERVARAAPGLQLVVSPQSDDAPIQLIAGELDLALGMFGELPTGLYRQRLFQESLLCIVRGDHPVVQDTLTLEHYLSLQHVTISTGTSTQSLVEVALQARGLTRRVALRLPYFLAGALIVARTDYILTLPGRLAQNVCSLAPVQAFHVPIEVPSWYFHQVWHERCHALPVHQWLRDQLADVARST